MKVTPTALDGVLLLEPDVFRDERGWFTELWQRDRFREATGVGAEFVQDNTAWSHPGVVRGLHFQWPDPQGKLIAVLHGAVLDVAVDVRRGSPTFGRWVAAELSAENRRQLWIPGGFAHGYATHAEGALVHYKTTAPYVRAHDRAVRWDDPAIGIAWPLREPTLSGKDRTAPLLADLDPAALPT